VTKWLSGTIPLEAECAACPDVQFKVQWDPRQSFVQPSRDHYASQLQQQFDQHLKTAHPDPQQDKEDPEG
jgi:hypothetical protein